MDETASRNNAAPRITGILKSKKIFHNSKSVYNIMPKTKLKEAVKYLIIVLVLMPLINQIGSYKPQIKDISIIETILNSPMITRVKLPI